MIARLLSGALFSALVVTAANEQSVLNANNEIPLLGFGTWNVQRSNASTVVAAALDAGYRHLDCAAIYGNEDVVGEGIEKGLQQASISRDDIWVTSKLWNDHHAPRDVPKALDKTLSDLGLKYLDLYLMHWPVAKSNGENAIDFIDTWKAMTQLSKNRVRHVGVSNFSPSQLQSLLKATPNDVPYAHQMEMHPYLPQTEFLNWHTDHGIHVTAYSPFGNTNPTYGSSRKENAAEAVTPLLDSALLKQVAAESDCTPAQVALKWGMQRGSSVIPKSSHSDRIVENFDSTKCDLSEADATRLATEFPVKRFNNPSKGWGVPLYDGLEDADTAATRGFQGEQLQRLKSVAMGWLGEVWRVLKGSNDDL